jgi:hypothetical protein
MRKWGAQVWCINQAASKFANLQGVNKCPWKDNGLVRDAKPAPIGESTDLAAGEVNYLQLGR